MFDTAEAPTTNTTQVLDDLRAARHTELTAAAAQLHLAATWADLHPVPTGATHAGWGDIDLHGEGRAPLAGQGTPQVAEFAPATLAAHLAIPLDTGKQLIANALELRHRLPRLWDLIHHTDTAAGTADHPVPAWRARQIADLTTTLSLDAVAWVDRMLTCDPQHLTLTRVRNVIDDAILFFDPDRAQAAHDAALTDRHVHLDRTDQHGGPATTDIHMRLDTHDALHLDDTIADLATQLARLGDTDPLDIRRAKSVGVLADPQHALDLLTHSTHTSTGTGTGTDPGPSHPGTHIELILHIDATDLADPERTGGRLEHLGPATRTLLTTWIARSDHITVRPVLDLHRTDTTDTHDPPDWMRRAALLRDATCVFPACTRSSTRADLDHIRPYHPPEQGGPPAQTSLANLAPLCRTHHRLKTHTTWTYQRLNDNHYAWTTPNGETLTVTTRPRHPRQPHRRPRRQPRTPHAP